MGSKTAEDATHVVADRFAAQVQHRRDLLRGMTARQELEHFLLPMRERRFSSRRKPCTGALHDAENSMEDRIPFDRHGADLDPSMLSAAQKNRDLVIGAERSTAHLLYLGPHSRRVLRCDNV
jgi:hypothetical protein